MIVGQCTCTALFEASVVDLKDVPTDVRSPALPPTPTSASRSEISHTSTKDTNTFPTVAAIGVPIPLLSQNVET
jgi:hypothetical protein